MGRRARILSVAGALLFAAVAVAIAGTVLSAGERDGDTLYAAASTMESQLLRQAFVVDAGTPGGLERFHELARPFDAALARGLEEARSRPAERALLLELSDLAAAWRLEAVRALTSPDAADAGRERATLLDRFATRAADLRRRLTASEAAAEDRMRRILATLVIVLGGLAFGAAGTAATRAWRRHTARAVEHRQQLIEDRRYRAEQEEFTRALQGARSEREAQRMLKRQLERTLPDGAATVLNRNNSDNRLEAVTAVPRDSPLAATLPDAEPADCLAVRFGQPQERTSGSAPLLSCELCGGVPGSVTCVPSLVGGEVIGSVVVETAEPLDDGGHRRLAEAVAHAAPVLSSMRNLRLAEVRASTDALTGMPNRRAAEETLKRMLAQADRSNAPCTVALFDLDHFKKVNDIYGHEKGDQLLAAVGHAVNSNVRASDFAARFGGEEFLLVLPETDLAGAMTACEQLRGAIADLRLAGLGQSPSASFGVAVFPADGAEPEALLRGADRALYAAKSSGRNCVKSLRLLPDADGAEPEAADQAEQAATVLPISIRDARSA